MSPKHLNSYKGRLNPSQVAEGMNIARRNARRLLEDAQILLDAHRYPTAASIVILSIEESGKASILRQLSLAETDEQASRIWKDFRSHTKKNILWLMPQLMMEGARQLDDFRSLFQPAAEHPYILDQVKQVSFYTDCLGKAHWSDPAEVVDKNLATMLTQIAKILASDNEVTTKEVELWVKHLGKAKSSSLTDQKEALLHWYAEMQELELAPKGQDLNDIICWLGLDANK
jgi:AbiV family abortive infection protein